MPIERLVIAAPGLLHHAAAETMSEPGAPPAHAPIRRDADGGALAAAPNLLRLLAIAGAPQWDDDGIDGFLASCYGIERQHDWPLGPVLLAALAGALDDDYCLVADPVTLIATHNDVQLTGVVADLAADETAAFLATLNAHFAADGLFFLAPQRPRWFVRSSRQERVATHPVKVAIGRSLRALLPSGADAGKWRRWQDEIQMLLHEHPVNTARQARGQRPVSGVWFWGGGIRPSAQPVAIATWTDDETAAALGAYLRMPVHELPKSLDRVLADDCALATRLVTLDPNASPAELEQAWFKPAWNALAQGRVATIRLIADGPSGGAMWTVGHPTVWQRLSLRFRQPDVAAMVSP